MQKYPYYVASGGNAVLVETNWRRACYARDKYMKHPQFIRGYYSLEEALEAARIHLLDIAGKRRIVPVKLEPHHFYTRNKLPLAD